MWQILLYMDLYINLYTNEVDWCIKQIKLEYYHIIKYSEQSCLTSVNMRDWTSKKMEPRIGFEPTTYALRMRCSTNWAISANLKYLSNTKDRLSVFKTIPTSSNKKWVDDGIHWGTQKSFNSTRYIKYCTYGKLKMINTLSYI